MTVRELIEELEEYPMDLPVINNVKELTTVKIADMIYYLDKSQVGYTYTPAVELE